jgi:hypothetical protein
LTVKHCPCPTIFLKANISHVVEIKRSTSHPKTAQNINLLPGENSSLLTAEADTFSSTEK